MNSLSKRINSDINAILRYIKLSSHEEIDVSNPRHLACWEQMEDALQDLVEIRNLLEREENANNKAQGIPEGVFS